MLNASLTVRKGEPNSHANKGWELLTGKAIELVARKRTQGVVFMAWGKFAQGRCKDLDVGYLEVISIHQTIDLPNYIEGKTQNFRVRTPEPVICKERLCKISRPLHSTTCVSDL